MSRIWRCVVAPVGLLIASAALVSVAPSILAQPPGVPGFEKGKDKDKAKEKDKGIGKKDGKLRPAEQLKDLEADLAKLKTLEADLQSQIEKLKETSTPPTAKESAAREGRGKGDQFENRPGPRGFGGQDRSGPPGRGGPPFGLERGGFGPAGLERGREFQRFAGPEMAHLTGRMLSFMSAEQLKEVIEELEKLRAEKLRAAAPQPREKDQPRSREGARPSTPTQNEEILKRLDRLSREIDEVRNSLKK